MKIKVQPRSKRTRAFAQSLAVLGIGALASCSGGGGSPATHLPLQTTSGTTAGTLSPQSTGTARFTLTVPNRATAAHARSTRFVSPSIASVSISAVTMGATASPSTFALTGANSVCTPVTGGQSCVITLSNVPVGNDTFEVIAYDANNQVLSHGKLAAAVSAGVTNVPIALDGIVSTATLVLSKANLISGAAGSVTATLNALDGDGNIIVGGGNYVDGSYTPLSFAVTASGLAGVTPSATTPITGPANNSVTLSYSGTGTGTYSFAVSASGIASSAILSVGASLMTLYGETSDFSNNTAIASFAVGATAPTRQLTQVPLGAYDSYQSVAVDSKSNIFVASAAGIEMFAPSARINATPTAVFGLTSPPSNLNTVHVFVDTHDNVYLSNYDSTANSVQVQKFTVSGNVATLVSTLTGLGSNSYSSLFFAVDGAGNIVYYSRNASTVLVVAFPSSGTVAVTAPRTFTSASNIYSNPAIDAAGRIYLSDSNAAIEVFAGGLTGSSSMLYSIGHPTAIGLAIDANGILTASHGFAFSDIDTSAVANSNPTPGSAVTVTPLRSTTFPQSFYAVARQTSGTIYLLGSEGLGIYSFVGSGTVPSPTPLGVLRQVTHSYDAFTIGLDGTTYVADYDGFYSSNYALFAYAPGTTGAASSSMRTGLSRISALATDPSDGSIYVYGSTAASSAPIIPESHTRRQQIAPQSVALLKYNPSNLSAAPTVVTARPPSLLAMSASKNGNIYATRNNASISVIPLSANAVATGTQGSAPACSMYAAGNIAVDDTNGVLYILCSGNQKLYRYSLTNLALSPGAITLPNSAYDANSIAVDSSGGLYVSAGSATNYYANPASAIGATATPTRTIANFTAGYSGGGTGYLNSLAIGP